LQIVIKLIFIALPSTGQPENKSLGTWNNLDFKKSQGRKKLCSRETKMWLKILTLKFMLIRNSRKAVKSIFAVLTTWQTIERAMKSFFTSKI